ncbi:hypothetical protein ACFW7J_04770 [Streptomyces sp. NPDC059525]|uniref:hypothetical protein n=1 Tax=Streptomyces sp. NPDC059525 TaxID=3346857 RepID=UPI0036B5C7EE
MTVALWIVTGLLAVVYLFGGAFEVITPKERIAAGGSSGRWVVASDAARPSSSWGT